MRALAAPHVPGISLMPDFDLDVAETVTLVRGWSARLHPPEYFQAISFDASRPRGTVTYHVAFNAQG